ncbi:MAG: hypothetical protein ACM30G_03275 [Micromonosporaceae bacterium]
MLRRLMLRHAADVVVTVAGDPHGNEPAAPLLHQAGSNGGPRRESA